LEKYLSLVVFIPPTISQFGEIISTNLSYVCRTRGICHQGTDGQLILQESADNDDDE
jgi:hypothetical protein